MSGHQYQDARGPLPIVPLPHAVVSLGRSAGLVGVIGLGLIAITALFGDTARDHVFRSLLFGFHFWLGPTLGAMAFVAISHMTGGGWGVVYRRFGEAAFTTLPWMFLVCMALALPSGYRHLFPWAHLDTFKPGGHDADADAYRVMSSRLPWYSWGWFFVRQLAYFFIWFFLMVQLRRGSLQLDRGPDPVLRRRLRKISAATVVLFFVTVTSYAMDYIMSRETNWYSSILGFVSAIEFGASAIAFGSLVLCYFADKKPMRDYLTPQHLNDLGNVLLALVVLWQYTSFAQLLIQWNGNLADDIGYYIHRGMGAVPNNWRFVALSLFLGHFLVPFFLLLMKGLKRKAATFGRICGWLLVMRVVESLWVIAPANTHVAHAWDTGKILWTDVVAFAGIGGVWLFLYFRALAAKPMLPQNATDQPELITHAAPHGSPVHAL